MGSMPEFIPKDQPESPILDLSHTLAPSTISSLNNSCAQLGYNAKVLILPGDYASPDLHSLALNLASTWHTNAGNTLLMVVDLKAHKVRVIGSPRMNKTGITSDYITNELIPRDFVPYMKAGDLSSAVRLSLKAVNRKLSGRETPAPQEVAHVPPPPKQTAIATVAQPATEDAPHTEMPLMTMLGVAAAIVVVVVVGVVLVKTRQKGNNLKDFAKLQQSIDRLHETANQLGLGSDYLDPHANARLCRDISDFFAKLLTLEKAYEETGKLVSTGADPGETASAVKRCNRYISNLDQTAKGLLSQVNQLTGYVPTYESKGIIPTTAAADLAESDGEAKQLVTGESRPNKQNNVITFPSGHSYCAPSWVVADNNDYLKAGGLAAIAVFLDRMQQRQTLDRMPATQYTGFSGNVNTASDRSGSQRKNDRDNDWYRSDNDNSSTNWHDNNSSWGSWDSGSGSDSSSDSGSSSDGGGSW
jgi:uncharacterized membrane protein YgcG